MTTFKYLYNVKGGKCVHGIGRQELSFDVVVAIVELTSRVPLYEVYTEMSVV